MAGYGPALPPGFADNEGESLIKRKDKRKDDTESDSSSDSSSSSSGAESPKKRKKTETSHAVIGPVIPQHLRAVAAASGAVEDKDDDEDFYGIGPVPEMAVKVGSVSVAAEFEQRAKKMKDKLLNPHAGESEITGRETWMTELPTQVANAFAGKMPTARKLTAGKDRATEDERAEWTDTPADKVRKEQERLEGRGGGKRVYEQVESSRDKMMAEKIQEFNQEKRAESLLDMHQKKIHKNDKKEKKKKSKSKKDKKEKKEKKKKKHKEKGKQKEEKVTRVPFDRETDLQVNKFDDAKRKLMIKRSAELNTRFGHSSAQKFL